MLVERCGVTSQRTRPNMESDIWSRTTRPSQSGRPSRAGRRQVVSCENCRSPRHIFWRSIVKKAHCGARRNPTWQIRVPAKVRYRFLPLGALGRLRSSRVTHRRSLRAAQDTEASQFPKPTPTPTIAARATPGSECNPVRTRKGMDHQKAQHSGRGQRLGCPGPALISANADGASPRPESTALLCSANSRVGLRLSLIHI